MTKKDYDLIASCIGASQTNYFDMPKQLSVVGDIYQRLELELELDNPKFNKQIFRDRVEYWRKQHGGS